MSSSQRLIRSWAAAQQPVVINAIAFLFSCVGIAGPTCSAFSEGPRAKQPVTIADSIRMNAVGGSPAIVFSPNKNRFVMIVKRGNLVRNTTDYSLLLWRTVIANANVRPEVLVTMRSSSNRPGIQDIAWLSDSESVVFLGEQPKQTHQVYSVNVKTHALRMLTHHNTNVLSYGINAKGDRLAYLAEAPHGSIWNDAANHEGIIVSTQLLTDLVQGQYGSRQFFTEYRLYAVDPTGSSKILNTIDPIRVYLGNKPLLSPDGRNVVIATQPYNSPEAWSGYSNPKIKQAISLRLARRMEILDTLTGKSRFLANSPLDTIGSQVAWSPDGRSVVVTRLFLPLDGIPSQEREERGTRSFTTEVDIATGRMKPIAQEDLIDPEWDWRTGTLHARIASMESNTFLESGNTVFLRKLRNGRWQRVNPPAQDQNSLEAYVEESMNTPPRVFLKDPSGKRSGLLLDLNPQFRNLTFARVEEIHWKASDGHDVKGGLYYPIHFVQGKTYPLVIQTHGWSAKRFMIDGPYDSAYGAQAFANHDIMVLQADDSNLMSSSNPTEGPKEAASYEGAIEYLDKKGLIDRDRVGIIGFSRTCLFVKYALTHSNFHFAAASVTDGTDGGYFQYVAFANAPHAAFLDGENINGGQPWGDGLKLWSEHSPGFNVYRVTTPLRIIALNPGSLLAEWEWFALLKRMGKPVEMLYLRDGSHQLVRPWDRLAAQEGNVDWFCFWLKGEESDPEKSEQYARWRSLREEQDRFWHQPTALSNVSSRPLQQPRRF